MIGTELVRELVETVILTGCIRDCDPCSLLLIAAPESGKTSVVLERPCRAIEAFADITGRGIHMVLAEKGKDITHIVINDLVAVLSHRQSVNRYTISQLNALTEEGLEKISTPAGIQIFKGGRKGVIASLTLEMAKDARHWWHKTGFASRMLPFCYYYPDDLIIKIKELIDDTRGRTIRLNGDDAHKKLSPKEFKTPIQPITVKYPDLVLKDIRHIADIRSLVMKEQGMRRLKQYHALAQAHAMLRCRTNPVVSELDVDFMKKIDLYVSYTEAHSL